MLHVQTRLIGLIVAGAIVFWGGAFLFGRIEDSNAHQRASQAADAAEKVYTAAVIEWHRDGDIYQACLTRVEDQAKTRDVLRTIFFAFADLSDVLPGNTDAELYTANRRALIEATYAPIDVPAVQKVQCLPPGPEPVDPTPPS
jgi:hypothetical protein